ncbi:hypothetical protein TNCV_2131471 [Trichonephila clavipes]|nr:hypothetical protein TNCV_2131471 [Trichonephila clavipes]
MFCAFGAWSYSKQTSNHKSSRKVGREREVGGLYHPYGVFSQNWGGTEPNRAVTCMDLKDMANTTGLYLVLCHDEYRGSRCDTVRQVALATKTVLGEEILSSIYYKIP